MYKLDEQFQEELNNLLNAFHEAVPESAVVVAGGCLRDYLLHKDLNKVKDIDVFIATKDSTYQVLEFIKHKFLKASCEFNLTYTSNEECTGTIDLGITILGKPVQLILVSKGTTVSDIIKRIDLGICQVGYSRNGMVMTTAFSKDRLNKCMTVVRCDSEAQAERTFNRFVRLNQKHPEFRFVVPQKLKKYFKVENLINGL